MLGGQPNHGWHICFPLEMHASESDFKFYDSSYLETYLLKRWYGPDASAVWLLPECLVDPFSYLCITFCNFIKLSCLFLAVL